MRAENFKGHLKEGNGRSLREQIWEGRLEIGNLFISFPVLGPTTGYELGFHLNQLVMAVSFMDTIQRDVRAANSVRQLVFTEDGIPVLAGLVRQRLEQSEAELATDQEREHSFL